MNLKCLPLPFWCTFDEEEALDCFMPINHTSSYKEIEPIVGKPGWYSKGKDEWYEVTFSGKLRAFQELKPGMFKYELEQRNHIPLSRDEVKMMRSYIRSRGDKDICKCMKRLLYVDEQWKALQCIARDGMRHRRDFLKRLERFKKENPR